MLAIASVLTTDVGLMLGRLQREQLQNTARNISRLLVVLWGTGLALIWLDTGFELAVLADSSKLLFKLLAVVVLTLNGWVLHRISFPVLLSENSLTLKDSTLLAVSGSISTFHWLLAAFIGVTTPLVRIPFDELVDVYAVLFITTVILSLICMPFFRHRVMRWRVSSNRMLYLDYSL